MDTLEEALELMKCIVEKSKGIEADKQEKKNKKKKKDQNAEKTRNKWDFETVPCSEFGKSLDDVFIAFLKWARIPKNGKKDANDADEEEENNGIEQVFNVTKAFRRLESYADWMASTGDDLLEPEFTASLMKEIDDVWKMKVGYSKAGHLIWWIDFKHFDPKAAKDKPDVDSLILVVWYSHFFMFDEKAQENGIMMMENIAKMGFFVMMTLIPPKLSAKLDRLTIGVLPIKFKKIYITECSTWINIIMAIMKPFMSKKMKSRIVTLDKDYSKVIEACGGLDYVMKGFGPCEGTFTDDPVAEKFA